MNPKRTEGILFAILAATLYAFSAPVSKLLLQKVPVTMMAAFLYLGAGAGLFIIGLFQKKTGRDQKEQPLSGGDLPYVTGMVLLDIAAPIFLMTGLSMTTAANAALLNNFEIVATSLIAFFIFRESISKRLGIAIVFVTAASILLSMNGRSSFSFSMGSLFVILACICWGFENNCTRMLSAKNPLHIVVIKGFFSGAGSLGIALFLGEKFPAAKYLCVALLLGFVAYGLSILFYIYAQRELGAAKTSTYYALAPFIGVAFSLVIFREIPGSLFLLALGIMGVGTYLAATD